MELDPLTAIVMLLLLSVIVILATMLYAANRSVQILGNKIDALTAQLEAITDSHKHILQKLTEIATPKLTPSIQTEQQSKTYDPSIAEGVATLAIRDYTKKMVKKPTRGRERSKSSYHAHRMGEIVIPVKSTTAVFAADVQRPFLCRSFPNLKQYKSPVSLTQTLMDTGSNAHVVNNHSYFIPGTFVYTNSECPINTFSGKQIKSIGYGVIGITVDEPSKGIVFTTAELVELAPCNIFSPA
eukprot:CAMPEP_0117885814 /NCGR_PEP_ID=MMETSP0950-20121206/19911_1 /TAXON_ID=44440 /ORGANISM="Chattonella subsalsa, Strain CCMP2191" /LENGTH=240 /DNA_ID=CAMNT_0005742867 /DNA_START=74 /DNA_END=792 /DNA_ORIENTATION=-